VDISFGIAGPGFRIWSQDGLAVVTAPPQITDDNAQQLWDALASVSCDHAVVVADMAATTCMSLSGISALLMALRCTTASGAELRTVITHPQVSEMFTVTSMRRVLPVFASLSAAKGASQARLGQAS